LYVPETSSTDHTTVNVSLLYVHEEMNTVSMVEKSIEQFSSVPPNKSMIVKRFVPTGLIEFSGVAITK
jgi:hypothetical protein